MGSLDLIISCCLAFLVVAFEVQMPCNGASRLATGGIIWEAWIS